MSFVLGRIVTMLTVFWFLIIFVTFEVGDKCTEDGGEWVPFYRSKTEYDNIMTSSGELSHEEEICEDILLNEDQAPDKVLYYNRILTAEPLDKPEDSSDKYKMMPTYGHYVLPPKYDFSDDASNNVWIVHFGIQAMGNPLLYLNKLTVSVVLSNPPSTIPIEFGNPSVNSTAEVETAEENLVVFFRLFCSLEIFSLVDIDVGLNFYNYADENQVNPLAFKGEAQASVSALGIRNEIAVATPAFEFNKNDRRFLEEGGSNDLSTIDWTGTCTFSCDGDLCDFFENVAKIVVEAFADATAALTEIFTEDIGALADAVEEKVGEWADSFISNVKDFGNAAKDFLLKAGTY